MNTRYLCLLLVVSLTCSAPLRAQDPDDESITNGTARDEDGLTPGPEETGDHSVTLQEALTLALTQSPRLTAFAWDIRAADARILQAGLRPNPELSVEVEEVRWTSGPSRRTRTSGIGTTPTLSWEQEREQGARSGFGEAEVTVAVGQIIEVGAKRARRVMVAKREKDTLLWDYEIARADVLAETARAFVRAVAAQQRLALLDELVRLAQEAANTTERRVTAGAASPLENNRAEVALATTQVARDQSERELIAAYARLASTWGNLEIDFGAVSGTLADVAALPTLDALEAEITRNPEIARWVAESALREARFQSERALRIPNLTLQLGFRSTGLADRSVRQFGYDTGGGFGLSRSNAGFDSDRDNSLVLGFSLPLPIFDRNQGNIAAAEYLASKTSHERKAVEATVWALLVEAREAAAAAVNQVEVLTAEVLPKAEETFAKTQRGYEQGKFGYLDVLDAQRTLFDVRTTHLDALARYNAAVIDIERLTGRALQEWNTDGGSPVRESDDEQ